MSNEISVKKICGNCKEQFELSKKDIHCIVVRLTMLFFFVCPKCGKYYFVQADDAESLVLLDKTKEMFTKLCVLRHNGKKIPKSLNEKYKKTNAKLGLVRKNLIQNFQNHKIEIDGKTVVIKFINL